MKHISLVRVQILAALLSLPALAALGQEADGLRAGTAAVDISPIVFPIQLRSGPSRHVHDPLHVRAIALQNGKGHAVIAVLDAIGIGRETCDKAKAIVAKKTGWRPRGMLVCATHTHSAPKGGDTTPGRVAYEKKRFDGIVQALTGAIQSLKPAKVGFASDKEPSEVCNRRWFLKPGTMDPNPFGELDRVRTNPPRDHLLKPAGPIDPEVCVVDVRTRRGRALGLIANYALHYVGGLPRAKEDDGRTVGMASADYFGEFARIMPHRVGGANPPDNFVAMMTNGASGDINNIDFYRKRPPRAPFEQVRVVATKTADAAWRAVKKIEKYDESPVIAVRQREVTLTYRTTTAAEVERARKILQLPRKDREKLHRRATQYARATVRYSEPGKTEKVIVQAIRIGEQAIVSMPFEVLVEIGLEIKRKSPFARTFLIELANGAYGYLPPPNQHELGGYETWIGTSRFQKDSSVILTRCLLKMLGELKSL